MVEERGDVYSKKVRAGKRTYFFDVRSTRGRDLYLTITESKKHTHPDGSATYDKHKIYLYKEDFTKFINGLKDAFEEIEYLRSNGFAERPAQTYDPQEEITALPITAEQVTPFSDLTFEDLDRRTI